MGWEQRRNIARYEAARELLDRCGELCAKLGNGELLYHADGVRRQLGWLVLALADGRIDDAMAEADAVERSLDVVLRRVGVRRDVLLAFDALATLQETLRERDTAKPTVNKVPPMGDWTTAVWEPAAG